jgi:hypothetical protein
MSAKDELEKLQAMRAELEAESRSLIEKQQSLEKGVHSLKEQVDAEELKKEKALVEDLRSRNEATKSAIAQLKSKKKELEAKLGQMSQTPEAAPNAQKINETPEKKEKAPEKNEAVSEKNGVTMTVVESEEMVETQKEQEEKKKFKFF